MSYVKADGTYINSTTTGPTFASQTAVTGAGATAAHEMGTEHYAALTLAVTAASGRLRR